MNYKKIYEKTKTTLKNTLAGIALFALTVLPVKTLYADKNQKSDYLKVRSSEINQSIERAYKSDFSYLQNQINHLYSHIHDKKDKTIITSLQDSLEKRRKNMTYLDEALKSVNDFKELDPFYLSTKEDDPHIKAVMRKESIDRAICYVRLAEENLKPQEYNQDLFTNIKFNLGKIERTRLISFPHSFHGRFYDLLEITESKETALLETQLNQLSSVYSGKAVTQR